MVETMDEKVTRLTTPQKKRGRKPGSRNKPKPLGVTVTRTGKKRGRRRSDERISLTHEDVLYIRENFQAYALEVTPDRQRDYEKQRQLGLSEQDVVRAIRGLKGVDLTRKLAEISNAQEKSFEDSLLERFDNPKILHVLGIPRINVDRKDRER